MKQKQDVLSEHSQRLEGATRSATQKQDVLSEQSQRLEGATRSAPRKQDVLSEHSQRLTGAAAWVPTRLLMAFLILLGTAMAATAFERLQQQIDVAPPGSTVWLEAAVVECHGPLFLKSGVTLRGRGPQATLRMAPGVMAPLLAPRDLKLGIRDCAVEQVILDGNSGVQSFTRNDWGKRFSATNLASVDNLGVYLKNATNVSIQRVTFRHFLNEGLMAVACAGLRIQGCHFSNVCQGTSPTNDFAQGAVYFRWTTESTLLSNRFQHCFEGSMVLGLGSHLNRVEGNLSEDSPSGEGILLGASASNRIVGNTVRRSSMGGAGKGAGISVSLPIGLDKKRFPSMGNLVSSNLIEDTGGPGITIMRADGTRVEGNEVRRANRNRNPGQGGIKAWQAEGISIRENRVLETVSGEAIVLQDCNAARFEDNSEH